jgi:hypothetical protein
VRTVLIVFFSLGFDHILGIPLAGEDVYIQVLVVELGVEAFNVGILPRAARCDVERPRPAFVQLALEGLGYEFGAVVAANVCRYTVEQGQPLK